MTGRYDHTDSGAQTGFSPDQLARLISAYGANPKRWPGSVGKLELKDVSMNAQLRAQLEAEGALDQALDSAPAIEVPGRLHERLLTRFDRFQEQEQARISRRIAKLIGSLRDLVWPGASWWQPTFALSLSILVGTSAGLVLPDSLADAGDQQVASLSDTPTTVDIDQGQ
jgi:hypothetical protein